MSVRHRVAATRILVSGLSSLMICSFGLSGAAAAQDGELDRPDIESGPPEYRVALFFRNDAFSADFSPWREFSLQVSRSGENGSIYGRLNQARRFGRDGTQFEMDAYPKLGKGRYAYVNAGFANEGVFPTFRASGEVWQSLPGSSELSLGVRLLQFSEDVWLYTGSVAHYRGNYWIAARPWIRFRDGSYSASVNLFIRRYKSGRDDYYGLILGAGSGISEFDTAAELDRLSSYKIGAEGRKPLADRWFLRWKMLVEREEYRLDRTRTRYGVDLGMERRFMR